MGWYTGDVYYDTILAGSFVFAFLTALGSTMMDGPYGRFSSEKYGMTLNPKWGWFLMELPATLSFVYFFFQGPNATELVPLIFLGIWLIHYGNRGFIFPLLMRAPKGSASGFSIMIVIVGMLVTSVHGYLNATFLTEFGRQYTTAWLLDPRFIMGVSLYYMGFLINVHSDRIIRNLRTKEEVATGEKVYRIPKGGLFSLITCPSYFSELLGWIGFAIASWSLGSLFVLLISAANLIPRAFATHRWYQQKFDAYPENRKVLIPFVI